MGKQYRYTGDAVVALFIHGAAYTADPARTYEANEVVVRERPDLFVETATGHDPALADANDRIESLIAENAELAAKAEQVDGLEAANKMLTEELASLTASKTQAPAPVEAATAVPGEKRAPRSK